MYHTDLNFSGQGDISCSTEQISGPLQLPAEPLHDVIAALLQWQHWRCFWSTALKTPTTCHRDGRSASSNIKDNMQMQIAKCTKMQDAWAALTEIKEETEAGQKISCNSPADQPLLEEERKIQHKIFNL